MANVRTFRINPEYGVPDRDIKEWLTELEEKHEQILSVQTQFIPQMGESDARMTVIATKLDDFRKE